MPYVEFNGLVTNGFSIVNSIIQGMIAPNWDALLNFTKEGIPYLVFETVAIAFLGTFIGLVLSVPVAFLSSRIL
ncbi:hypothetical protein MGH68_11240 [Erysipelothrix sp. D19-032]